jgi:hypothetical protein
LECCCLWIRNTDRRGDGEGAVNVYDTWSLRGVLKIKWTDRITSGEVFQRAKEEILLLKFYNVDANHV